MPLYNPAGGGTPALDACLAPSDIATLNASTTAHGLLKKLSNVALEFMNGQGNWATVTASTPDIVLSKLTVSSDYTITAGYSAVVVRQLTIASGKKLTIGSGARLRIL